MALALSGAGATAFHAPPDGLPDLPEDTWAQWVAAGEDDAPPMLLLAAAPRNGAFALERWLARAEPCGEAAFTC